MKKLKHPYAYGKKPRFPDEHKKFGHAHIYYLCSIVALALFVFCTVQGIITHTALADVTQHSLVVALLLYIVGAFFLSISITCYKRGVIHHPYPWHK